MIKTVKVKFAESYNNKSYDFLCDIDDIEIGDYVVTDSANGLGVAKVQEINDGVSSKATKFIVQKIDMEKHNIRLEQQKRVATLRQKLEDRRKALQEMHVYQLLAKEDPEMALLLKEYEEVVK